MAVPKKIFDYSNKELRLRRLEYQAAQLSDERDDFEEDLKESAGRLRALKNLLPTIDDEELHNKINIMWNTLSETDTYFKNSEPNKEQQDYAKNIKAEKLPSLNKKLKKACHEYKRAEK